MSKELHFKTTLPRMAVSFFVGVLLILAASPVNADELSVRSVTVARPNPDTITDYDFSFRYAQPLVTGSVLLQFCSNSPLIDLPCTTPVGLDTTTAVLDAQSGFIGFTEDVSVNGEILLTRLPTNASLAQSVYSFSDITNPSNFGTVFVRIQTFASTDATGPSIDSGAVAYSIQPDINISAFVPPRLDFCFGVDIPNNDCTEVNGSFLDLGLFESETTVTGSAQFVAGTNAFTGYNVQLVGKTLTSGNNIIPALTTPAGSQQGVSQFGFNLRDNSQPDIGANFFGPGSGRPLPDYDVANNYSFNEGATIARSTISTENNRFSMSFIVNVEEDQPPGIYNTTLTLIAFANF